MPKMRSISLNALMSFYSMMHWWVRWFKGPEEGSINQISRRQDCPIMKSFRYFNLLESQVHPEATKRRLPESAKSCGYLRVHPFS